MWSEIHILNTEADGCTLGLTEEASGVSSANLFLSWAARSFLERALPTWRTAGESSGKSITILKINNEKYLK